MVIKIPYEIKRVAGGFKVGHKGTDKVYSKHPQSRNMAERQRRAIAASEFSHGATAHK